MTKQLRITRLKSFYEPLNNRHIYIKIDGETPELYTHIKHYHPAGGIEHITTHCSCFERANQTEVFRVSKEPHTIRVDSYQYHSEISIEENIHEVFCWFDKKGVLHVDTTKPFPSWIKSVIIISVILYALSFLIGILNLFMI